MCTTELRILNHVVFRVLNACMCAPEYTTGPAKCIRHAGGTVGDRVSRPNRIPATTRTHKYARGLQQPGSLPRPGAEGVRDDARASGRKAGSDASTCSSVSTSANGRAAAAGDSTGTCAQARKAIALGSHVWAGARAGRGSRLRKLTAKLGEAA